MSDYTKKLSSDLFSSKPSKKSLRAAFGNKLKDLVSEENKIIGLDADVGSSTGVEKIFDKLPSRFVQGGIAEANLIGVSAGLSLVGFTPYVATFAAFAAGRVYDQIRQNLAYENVYQDMNVKVIGTHCGLGVGPDGATHQALEDLALIRAVPDKVKINDASGKLEKETNFRILAPADAVQTEKMVEWMNENTGLVYMRIPRADLPIIYNDYEYPSGGEPDLLMDGSDLTIMAHGEMVYNSLMVATLLKQDGISAQVVNVHTLKPLHKEYLRKCLTKTGLGVTIEDHQLRGGLGTAVRDEVLKTFFKVPVKKFYVAGFGESGNPEKLYKKYGLDVKSL
ncbi:MAG: transketolase C-terminal domain-containing protein, partial [archaeon]